MTEIKNPWEDALSKFSKISEILKLDPKVVEYLTTPNNIVNKKVSIQMDNGDTKEFDAYRVQFNNLLGPYKGGIRFHPRADLDDVKALSYGMMMKTSLVGVPLGGGKGGITCNPKELSIKEIERLSRAYARALKDDIGPQKDIPAPDVYTNPQIMAWIMDEFCKIKGKSLPGVITGKPVEIGGSLGRGSATAQGGVYVLEEAMKKLDIKDPKIVVQGFGNAGSIAAKILHEMGFKVIAVSDSKGAIFDANGLDIPTVVEHKTKTRAVKDFPSSENKTNEELLELECDVLIPAALEGVISEENANKIKTKIILELANGPVTSEARPILHDKGIMDIPDILANAGGVTVSYFEWVQNNYGYYWKLDEVNSKLKEQMVDAFNRVYETMEEHKKDNVDMPMAANIVAVKRLVKAMELRGFEEK